ncbi:hypothetical protein [Brevibacillus sp. NRS-1366]|uniref:hypothetical protein n=1 Tax=Brevibacillus sp. NRS-1366 TaxID=3233899 RepID=UPI003D206858
MNRIVNANSKYIEKDGFLIDPITQTPATDFIENDKDSPLAKQRTVTLINGIDKSVVAEVTLDEYFESPIQYEELLTDKTNRAREALIKSGKWEVY